MTEGERAEQNAKKEVYEYTLIYKDRSTLISEEAYNILRASLQMGEVSKADQYIFAVFEQGKLVVIKRKV